MAGVDTAQSASCPVVTLRACLGKLLWITRHSSAHRSRTNLSSQPDAGNSPSRMFRQTFIDPTTFFADTQKSYESPPKTTRRLPYAPVTRSRRFIVKYWRDNTTHSAADVDTQKVGTIRYTPVAHCRLLSYHATSVRQNKPYFGANKSVGGNVGRVSSPLERIRPMILGLWIYG